MQRTKSHPSTSFEEMIKRNIIGYARNKSSPASSHAAKEEAIDKIVNLWINHVVSLYDERKIGRLDKQIKIGWQFAIFLTPLKPAVAVQK